MAMLIVSDDDFAAELTRLGISPVVLTEQLDNGLKDVLAEHNAPSEEEEVIIEKEASAIETVVIEQIQRGRGSIQQIPNPIRQFIAEESLSGVPAKELSDKMGVSESSISAYKHGATSTASYNKPQDELFNHANRVKSALATKARGRLITAIDSLTDAKISEAKAKDIAGIAKDMAAVVKSLEKETDGDNKPQVQFVFFAPKVKAESYFPVIEVAD
jgi:hypothetical protein